MPMITKIKDHLKLKSKNGALPYPNISKILIKINAIPCNCFFIIHSHSFVKFKACASFSIRHADRLVRQACSLWRRSTYTSSLECACPCASTQQSPSAHLHMTRCYARNTTLPSQIVVQTTPSNSHPVKGVLEALEAYSSNT